MKYKKACQRLVLVTEKRFVSEYCPNPDKHGLTFYLQIKKYDLLKLEEPRPCIIMLKKVI